MFRKSLHSAARALGGFLRFVLTIIVLAWQLPQLLLGLLYMVCRGWAKDLRQKWFEQTFCQLATTRFLKGTAVTIPAWAMYRTDLDHGVIFGVLTFLPDNSHPVVRRVVVGHAFLSAVAGPLYLVLLFAWIWVMISYDLDYESTYTGRLILRLGRVDKESLCSYREAMLDETIERTR